MVKVKCRDCGFLAMQANYAEWVEADSMLRNSGVPDNVRQRNLGNWPQCFMRKYDLQAEMREIEQQRAEQKEVRERHRLVLMVVNEERCCCEYTDWRMGFSPKEHREMLDRQRLLEWQTEEAKKNRRYRIAELVIAILGVIAIVAIGLLSALVERGILFGQPITR